jgi:hypothetical protein
MPDNSNDPKVTHQLRKDWNDYTSWLAARGMKGNPALDKNDLGGQMIDKYRKENPGTLVSRDSVKDIQGEFQKYRDWSLAEIKAGRSQFGPQVNEGNYMKGLSTIDGIAGQRTTSFSFPKSYITTFDNGKNMGTEDKGFATTNK